MLLDYLYTKRRWMPFRLILDLLFALIVIGIGIFCFDNYFYVWIYSFLNVITATLITFISVLYVYPIFREKDTEIKYSKFNQMFAYATLAIGATIIILNVIGLLLIPNDFDPVFKLNSERIIRLFIYLLYCFLADFSLSIFSARVSYHLKGHSETLKKEKFAISTSFEKDRYASTIGKIDKLILFMSCYFESLLVSGIVYLICSFVLSPYMNPNMPLPFVK